MEEKTLFDKIGVNGDERDVEKSIHYAWSAKREQLLGEKARGFLMNSLFPCGPCVLWLILDFFRVVRVFRG